MQKSPRIQGPESRAGEVTRKQLIRREMRFVLQRDVRRFSQQLLARLLDEGCNLNAALARMMFYEDFVRRLAAGLTDDTRNCDCQMTPDMAVIDTHRRYLAVVKYFLAHLSDAEAQITAAVLDVIEALKLDWQRTAKKCLSNANQRDPDLQNLIEQISRVNPDGKLAQHDLEKIRHRLRIAVVTSLLRHVHRPDLLRDKFGSISQILQNLGQEPALFPALMAIFKKDIPYAPHVIAQSFWRTLNNMDNETPDPNSGSKIQANSRVEP
jgi:hypothetical protein